MIYSLYPLLKVVSGISLHPPRPDGDWVTTFEDSVHHGQADIQIVKYQYMGGGSWKVWSQYDVNAGHHYVVANQNDPTGYRN